MFSFSLVKMSVEEKEKVWPVHSLIQELKLNAPVALEGAAAELIAVMNLRRGILGSSASNLDRTDVLRCFPFRIGFGTAGDLAWGLEHAGEVRIAIVPQSFSTFMFHPNSYAKSDYAVADFNEKCLLVARDAVDKGAWRMSGAVQSSNAERLLKELLVAWEKHLTEKRRVAQTKQSLWWWLAPTSWQAHRDRARTLRDLEAVQDNAMLELEAHVAHHSLPQ